jgi:hypothetical protein
LFLTHSGMPANAPIVVHGLPARCASHRNRTLYTIGRGRSGLTALNPSNTLVTRTRSALTAPRRSRAPMSRRLAELAEACWACFCSCVRSPLPLLATVALRSALRPRSGSSTG